jgi:rifampicin phosphotransferase
VAGIWAACNARTASHAAIVSRELGLPCVINTRTGTEHIHTGDMLRVDGSAGVVTILKPADD